jgi:hypothetical protein
MRETWKKYGMVDVNRDAKGRIVTWQKWKPPTVSEYGNSGYGYGGKGVSIYGTAYANGIVYSPRYDFYGSGKELYKAIFLAHRIVPKKRFMRLSARDFVNNPYRYGWKGYWLDREVNS